MSFSFHFTRKVIEVDYRLCVRRGCDTRKLEQISRQNNYRKQKILNKAVEYLCQSNATSTAPCLRLLQKRVQHFRKVMSIFSFRKRQ